MPLGISMIRPALTVAAIASIAKTSSLVPIGLASLASGKLVSSPLFESGVTVPIAGSDAAACSQPRDKISRHKGVGIEKNDIFVAKLVERPIDRADKSKVSWIFEQQDGRVDSRMFKIFGDPDVWRCIVNQNDAVIAARIVTRTKDFPDTSYRFKIGKNRHHDCYRPRLDWVFVAICGFPIFQVAFHSPPPG